MMFDHLLCRTAVKTTIYLDFYPCWRYRAMSTAQTQEMITRPRYATLCAVDANELHLSAYRRALTARGRSDLTQKSYREAIGQLVDHYPDRDLAELTRADIEAYLAAVLAAHSASTAANRFRSLRAFYRWMVEEEYIDRSPLERMREPKATMKPVPVVPDDQLKALLKACNGKDFEDRRDTALIRIFCEPGSPRVAEMAGLTLDTVDLRRDLIRLHGKGDKIREIPFGPRTGQALDRYLAVRRRHRYADLPALWLGLKGRLTASGIAQVLDRRGERAGIDHIHPHQLRHTAASDWLGEGGGEQDAMELFGWSSPVMLQVYGRAARTDRAHKAARRSTRADRL